MTRILRTSAHRSAHSSCKYRRWIFMDNGVVCCLRPARSLWCGLRMRDHVGRIARAQPYQRPRVLCDRSGSADRRFENGQQQRTKYKQKKPHVCYALYARPVRPILISDYSLQLRLARARARAKFMRACCASASAHRRRRPKMRARAPAPSD